MLPNPPAAPLSLSSSPSPLSHVPHTHVSQVPPPPPNTYTHRAVNAASNAARRRPRMYRRPLIHALLLYSTDTDSAELFAYTRQVVDVFGQHGIDVYLQTDVILSRSNGNANVNINGNGDTNGTISPAGGVSLPIVHENVENIVSNSEIEYIILLTDRDVANRTVQVRRSDAQFGQFVETSLDTHANDILQSWAAAIEREASICPDHLFSLGMNPNVVTNKHIDFFLQQHPVLRGIRSAYATLARLVDTTQKSGSISDTKVDPQSDTVSTGAENSDATDSDKALNDAPVENLGEDGNDKEKEEYEKLAKKALRIGLDALLQQQPNTASKAAPTDDDDDIDNDSSNDNNTDNASINDENDVLKNASPTMRWIKRSPEESAQMLRGRFLVRSLHSKLVDTFPTVAAAPVSISPMPRELVYTVPSEAHRQRLLREMNFLVLRMEELGARLSSERQNNNIPRRKRRCRINPWTSYIDHFKSNDNNTDKQNPDLTPSSLPGGKSQHEQENKYHMNDMNADEAWRCTGCHSKNKRNSAKCRYCGAPSCILERGLLPRDSEAMDSCVREAIKASTQQIRPWIFGPTPLPLPTSMPRRRTPNPISIASSTSTSTSNSIHNHGSRPHALSADSVHAQPFSLGAIPIPPIPSIPTIPSPPASLMEAFRGISLEDNNMPLPLPPHVPPPPPPPPPPPMRARSPPGYFGLPNGRSGLSKVNAIPVPVPITRPRDNGLNYNHTNSHGNSNNDYDHFNGGREVPCRSPGSSQFLHRRSSIHRRLMDDHRPSSFDATLLGGNSLSSMVSPSFPNARSRWVVGNNKSDGTGSANDEAEHNHLLGRSPPQTFRNIKGYRTGSNTPESTMPFFDFEPREERGDLGMARTYFDDQIVRHEGIHHEILGYGLPPRLPHQYTNGIGHDYVNNNVNGHGHSNSNMHETGGFSGARFPRLEQRTSLEDLAAASDAANGGLGSANAESIRAVMAYRADNESKGDNREDKRKNKIGNKINPSSGYGLF